MPTLAVRIPRTKRDKVKGHIRIKAIDLPIIRKALLDAQDWICPLCERDLRYIKPQQRCVDHSHTQTGDSAGAVRDILCSNCNGNEGRIRTRVLAAKGHMSEIDWLQNLVDYWRKHTENQTGLIHYTYKTADEKRLLKNKKARQRRRLAR